ncbi:major royal jelly protein 9-like isoform X2 [Haematobia irritans]
MSILFRLSLALICLCICCNGYSPMMNGEMLNSNLQIPCTWKILDFAFPSDAEMKAAVESSNYVENNGLPIDVQPHYQKNKKRRIFVTIPRFQTGIPYTLATLSDEMGPNGPLLQPYPSYRAHNVNGDDCDQITSVFRVAITECNQMWVMDSGSVGVETRCPPQLLLFDLNTDQLLHRYRLNTTVYTPSASLFVTPIVVVKDPPPRGSCRRSMVYVADVNFHGLVVYDYMANSSWRVEHPFMYPDPDYGIHTVARESFTLMDGIIGLTTDRRQMFFHSMASISEYAVPLHILDNSTNFIHGGSGAPESFMYLGKRTSECVATATDSRDNVYCVTFNPIELISWNINTRYNNKSFRKIPINPQLLEFVSGMKVVTNNQGKEELWILSNRFQKIAAGTQNTKDSNFRILVYTLGNVRTGQNDDLTNRLVFTK